MELGLEEHVLFVNQYLDQKDIIDYLLASDVYVTPYLDPQQITDLLQSSSVDVPVTVTRLNGSSGDVDMQVSGLPSGVSGFFGASPGTSGSFFSGSFFSDSTSRDSITVIPWPVADDRLMTIRLTSPTPWA